MTNYHWVGVEADPLADVGGREGARVGSGGRRLLRAAAVAAHDLLGVVAVVDGGVEDEVGGAPELVRRQVVVLPHALVEVRAAGA